MSRRIARVRPEGVRYALHQRLGRARRVLRLLREAEEPRVTMDLNSADLAGDFLVLTRGVYSRAETFHEGQTGSEFHSCDWYEGWLNGLTDRERALWAQLRADRVAEAHGEGFDLAIVNVGIPPDDPEIPRILKVEAGAPVPKLTKPVARFAADPDRPASEVCADYLVLAEKFVRDFLRDYARVIPKGA